MIVYGSEMALNDVVAYLQNDNKLSKMWEIQNIAFKLRNEILAMKKNPLPEKIDLASIFNNLSYYGFFQK